MLDDEKLGNTSLRLFSVVFIILAFFASLVVPAFSSLTVTQQIQAAGQIASPPNLALIPNDWTYGYYADVPQYVFVDYNVTYNGDPSLRLQPGGGIDDFNLSDRAAWMNCPFGVSVNPGDNISCSAYLETGISNDSGLYGFRIGIDMWSSGFSYDLGGPHSNYVPWNSTWTLVTINFTVPTTNFTENEVGNSIPSCQASYIEMWCQANNANDSGNVWISDAQLYINS
ncbi:MAG: hypothetical protein ABSD92_05195 [Candidatus Bathyarchaeia archaeon]